ELTGSLPNIEVLPMGVTLASYHADEERTAVLDRDGHESKTVLFVGRLSEVKGADVLIRAAARLHNVRVVVAGDGPERDSLIELSRRLAVDVLFTGRVSAACCRQLLRAADVVAIPSLILPDGRTEGLPVVCLEAMAAGKPVVASRVGGLAELLEHGVNGFLCEPGNDLDVARTLSLVLENRRLADAVAQNARVRVNEYDWCEVGGRYRALIRSALGQEASTAAAGHSKLGRIGMGLSEHGT